MGNLEFLKYESLLDKQLPIEINTQHRIPHKNNYKSVNIAPMPKLRNVFWDGLAGWLAWLTIGIAIVGAFINPPFIFALSALVGAYIAIRFVIAGILAVRGMRHIQQAQTTNWRAEYDHLRDANSLAWEDVLHVAIIPNYKEEDTVLIDTINRLAESPIAREQLCLVLAMEDREKGAFAKATGFELAYKDKFRHIVKTFHPKDIPGEVAGKSSNEAWASKEAFKTLVYRYGYDIDKMVITIMDADSLVHPHYFEALTCKFATADTTTRSSTVWQAPIRYDNNIWKVHPFFTFLHAYSAVWFLSTLSRRNPMPFSTYSLSFRLAHDAGFWDGDVIPEDWHMFIKCYFKQHGNLCVRPIYLPFSCYSAAVGETFVDATRSYYTQAVRHMWGAEDVGYIVHQADQSNMPLHKKFSILWRVLHNHSLATVGWLATNLGIHIAIFLHPNLFGDEIIAQQMGILQAVIQVIILMSIFFWILDIQMRPPKGEWTLEDVFIIGIGFLVMPFTTVALCILPALEAQTRLMLGIPITYRVARKV